MNLLEPEVEGMQPRCMPLRAENHPGIAIAEEGRGRQLPARDRLAKAVTAPPPHPVAGLSERKPRKHTDTSVHHHTISERCS